MSVTLAIIIANIVVITATLVPTYIISNKHKTSEEDWAVASRSLPLYVVVGTQFASAMGGGILVGHVGNAYENGIAVLIYGVLTVLPFIFIMYPAKWLRKNNYSTIPEILRNFSNNNAVTVVAAIMTIIVPFGWVTSQITAFGSIYTMLTGIDYNLLCIVFCIVSLFFVMPSGLKTVAWTDFIFSCFMILMLIVSLVFAINLGGGMSGIMDKVDPQIISMSGSVEKLGLSTVFLWVFAILPGGITNQLYFQRVCAIEDEKKINKSLILSAIITFIGFLWAVVMGIGISAINPSLEGEAATGWFMTQLPVPLLAGFAALIFATMMSTVSSGVQSVVVNITRDIVPIVKPGLSPNQTLKLSRTLSLLVMVVAVLMCLVFTDTLTWLVSTYAFSAATLLCPIYVGYAFRNTNFITTQGIVASMIAGAVGCVVGIIMKTAINYAAIGIVFSLIVLLVVSKFTSNEVTEEKASNNEEVPEA